MSDTGNDAAAKGVSSAIFTEREMQMLAWAMQSLKSGPPDIDYDKLAAFAGMSNPRSASNAWAKIRNKLNDATADGTLTVTPKKGGAKKKAAAKDENGDDEGADGDAGKKTPRKRGPKKQEVDGETSPKKRGRPAKAKKGSDNETNNVEAEVKKEVKEEDTSEDVKDLQPDAETKLEEEEV